MPYAASNRNTFQSHVHFPCVALPAARYPDRLHDHHPPTSKRPASPKQLHHTHVRHMHITPCERDNAQRASAHTQQGLGDMTAEAPTSCWTHFQGRLPNEDPQSIYQFFAALPPTTRDIHPGAGTREERKYCAGMGASSTRGCWRGRSTYLIVCWEGGASEDVTWPRARRMLIYSGVCGYTGYVWLGASASPALGRAG